MRVDHPFILFRWFQLAFPCLAPRAIPAPIKCCPTVCDTVKAAEAPRFAYWAYLERQNMRDANIDWGLPSGPGMCAPACSTQTLYAPSACKASDSKPSVGLGGPTLGYVPPPTDDATAAPERAPVRTVRVYEPGVHATALDIIA